MKTIIFCPECGKQWDWTLSEDPHERWGAAVCDDCYVDLERQRECEDCKQMCWPRSMFVCPDNKLRCGGCVVKRETKAYPEQEERRNVQ